MLYRMFFIWIWKNINCNRYLIVLEKQEDSLFTDLLQFGFKIIFSMVVICTSMFLEPMGYYNENGTYCYLLLLDLSKAFDRV